MKVQCEQCREIQSPEGEYCIKCGAMLPPSPVVRERKEHAPEGIDTLTRAFGAYEEATRAVGELQVDVARRMEELRGDFSRTLVEQSLSDVDIDKAADFLSQPFLVERIGASDYYVHVPQFMNLHIGWLVKRTKSYRTYRLNIYSMFDKGLPEWLKGHISIPDPPKVSITEHEGNSYLWAPNMSALHVDEMFPMLLGPPDTEGRYLISNDDALFQVRVTLAQRGRLLQKRVLVDRGELLPAPDGMVLRPHQDHAWEQFLTHGRVGVYLPPQSGKSYMGVYACARVPRHKLVLVPTKTLKNQWMGEVEQWGAKDVTVETYQAASTGTANSVALEREHELVVMDECHRIPAESFKKIACLHYHYSLGLSASPFREDGREVEIFALTGKPVFCDWGEYFSNTNLQRPTIKIIVCTSGRDKITEAMGLCGGDKAGRTLLFVNHIKTGEELSRRLHVPFYHANNQPEDGDVFKLSAYWKQSESFHGQPIQTVILSRIGDEGLRIDGLRRVVVVESLGDSRRQEVQRLGRLLRNSTESEYVMLMTRKEREGHGKKMDEVLTLDGFVIEEVWK